ncbi:hypothetical protein [Bacteroides stercorirosoris]|jgi:hypothetical protein|uniref:Uncharacterized protein n=1 Tax=Bacteroides stercorirosoris TaxID=871324 RepID=A0A1M6EQG8_9BACE|nr:hypothetical protein [Bacteroides stercorirosoris]OKZ14426.1 MAG: hypothetical protein BHV75_00995 [Bacteroides oleiciplenus]SHI87683.1 hypothetical protein SAMN05444350_11012 [Bacteroides stercorirosoris]
MADIITRLLLDTKNFDAKLDRSKSSVNSFQGGISNMAKTAGAGVLKFAGTLGIAMGAGEAFNRVLNSSQTLGDMTASNMAALKTSVDEFFYSLGTGTFDNFLSGLGSVIDKAKEAYSAIDQLGNTQISYGVYSAKNQSEIADAQYIAKNKFASVDERSVAFDKWRMALENQQNNNQTLQKQLIEAASKAVESRTGANIQITLEDLLNSFEVDLLNPESRTIVKERAMRGTNNYTAWSKAHKDDKEGIDQLAQVQKQNIITHTMLEKYSDDELKDIAAKITQYYQLNSALKSTAREYNETANEFNNANKAVKGFTAVASLEGYKVYSGSSTPTGTKPTPSPAGSAGFLNEQIAAKNKELLNATTVQARAEIQKTISELEARKINLNIATEKEIFRDKYGENKLDATKAQKQFSEYINVDKEISAKSKELTNATTEQARVAVQKTISELEEKKIKLKVSIEKEIQTNSVDSKTKKDFSEYVSVEEDILKQNTLLINTTTEQARIAVQNTIDELEAKKVQITANVSVKSDMSSEMAGVLNNGSIDRKGKQITKGSNATDISGIKLPKYEPIFKKEDVDLNNDFADSLSGIGDMMGSLSSLFDENTASALQWGSTLLMAIAQATPAILGMMGVKEQDTATTNKNTTAEVVNAGAKVMSAHSSIPFVGIALGLAGVAAIIAAMSSMPHFATGGIVPGTSFAGDKVPALLNSGEMILNGSQQGNLFKILNSGMYDSLSRTISPLPENSEIRLSSNITVRGDTLYLALNNYMKRTGKKL